MCGVVQTRLKALEGAGAVFVEFSRAETATTVAHALHLRKFANRAVQVAYYPINKYQNYFGKGMEAVTLEQKQALALIAHEKLAGLITAG
jgi:hypothetical protein